MYGKHNYTRFKALKIFLSQDEWMNNNTHMNYINLVSF